MTKTFIVVAALAVTLLASCAKQEQFGQPVPSDVPTVKLAEIMKNPGAYKDKEVVLDGNYAGHCCPTDFNYKEGVNGVECYYPGYDVPETKAGRPVRIYAVVRARRPEGDKEPQVHVEAKGVQFK